MLSVSIVGPSNCSFTTSLPRASSSALAVRGIGRWTAEMLLIFHLGRPDALPVDDFGVRNGFRIAYGRRALPTPKPMLRYGEQWKPYRTVASWYLWRAADGARRKRAVQQING